MDRYTVVFAGRYDRKRSGEVVILNGSGHNEVSSIHTADHEIDRPGQHALGKAIHPTRLPSAVQSAVTNVLQSLTGSEWDTASLNAIFS